MSKHTLPHTKTRFSARQNALWRASKHALACVKTRQTRKAHTPIVLCATQTPMAYLQYHDLGPRNHTDRCERLRALRVHVHAILVEDWDLRPVPRQRRSLELICHAAAAEPHAGPELCAQAALCNMRRQGLSLRELQYGFTTSVWCTLMATVLSQRRALSMHRVTELSFEMETLQGSRLLRAQVRACKTS